MEKTNKQTIKNYTTVSLTKSNLLTLIETGINAPSVQKNQSSTFIVTTNSKIIEESVKLFTTNVVFEMPELLIFVCHDPIVKGNNNHVIPDNSTAAQSIFIKTKELKLGAIWQPIFPVQEKITNSSSILNTKKEVFSILAYGKANKNVLESIKEKQFDCVEIIK